MFLWVFRGTVGKFGPKRGGPTTGSTRASRRARFRGRDRPWGAGNVEIRRGPQGELERGLGCMGYSGQKCELKITSFPRTVLNTACIKSVGCIKGRVKRRTELRKRVLRIARRIF